MYKFITKTRKLPSLFITRKFLHSTPLYNKILPFNLADIGEGIQECEIVSWFIKQGDTIQQFDKICEVQSDKASVEITSRFDGLVKKLHHEVGDMAKVGMPLIDIEVSDDVAEAPAPVRDAGKEFASVGESVSGKAFVAAGESVAGKESATREESSTGKESVAGESISKREPISTQTTLSPRQQEIQSLATPAVRRIAKENGIDIRQISGSGKEGVRNKKTTTNPHTESTKERRGTLLDKSSRDKSNITKGLEGTLDSTAKKYVQKHDEISNNSSLALHGTSLSRRRHPNEKRHQQEFGKRRIQN
jgi:2-oxoisovalerate dehydrogenase E2 component (dihydrolipoyl transacylase)